MHKSKNIWVDYEFNPVTGCLKNCEDCELGKNSMKLSGDIRLNITDKRCKPYTPNPNEEFPLYWLSEQFRNARNRAIPFPFGAAPTFHEYRLEFPEKVPTGSNILVGNLGDMFADYIPDEWITRVFEACKKTPRHNYLFITRNAHRYADLDDKGLLPKLPNFWYGTSIPENAIKINFSDVDNSFLYAPASIIGLLKEINILGENKWYIVADTDKIKPKDKQEYSKAVERLCKDLCWEGKIVFSEYTAEGFNFPKEMPKELKRHEPSDRYKKSCYDKCAFCGKEQPKLEMTTVIARKGRRGKAETIGFICDNCLPKFKSLFEKDNLISEGKE